jgi:hypothetical protein
VLFTAGAFRRLAAPRSLAAPPLTIETPASACAAPTGDTLFEVDRNDAALEGPVELNATVPGISGKLRATFYSSPAEEENWTEITAGEGEGEVSGPFDTFNAPNGDFDFCVVVEKVGEGGTTVQHVAVARDRLIANRVTVVALAKPSVFLHGKVALETKLITGVEAPNLTAATFEYKPSGKGGAWTAIETVPVTLVEGGEHYAYRLNTPFDTTALAPGHYDLRLVAVPEEGKAEFVSAPIRELFVDNTPPTVTMESLPSPLGGDVTLVAHASDTLPNGEPGPGIRSVTFERSRTGVAAFQKIGAVTASSGSNTYSYLLHTEAIPNGVYDFRVRAADRAGNSPTVSSVVSGIDIQNASFGPPVSSRVSGVTPPANKITMLGAVKDGGEPETLAYGFTSAPPGLGPGGHPLEYTASPNQLVLLRYTQHEGWQVHEVLDGEHGEAFRLLEPDKVAAIEVNGAITPSGEGWLWLAELPTEAGAAPAYGLFHRGAGPNQPFELDHEATETVGRTLIGWKQAKPHNSLDVSLHLGEEGGQVSGLLTVGGQPETTVALPGPHGSETVSVVEQLSYWALAGGDWKPETASPRNTAELPSTFPTLSPGDKLTLPAADASGAGAGWGALCDQGCSGRGMLLGHFETEGDGEVHWSYSSTGLDALDLTAGLAQGASVEPKALKAEDNGEGGAVWIGARVHPAHSEQFEVVARYDRAKRAVTNSWCSLPEVVENNCQEELGAAAVPDAVFPGEKAAVALKNQTIHVFAHERWSSYSAPGYVGQGDPENLFSPTEEGGAAFTAPGEGWLAGDSALGHWSPEAGAAALTPWPVPDRFTLTSIALPPAADIPPGGPGRIGEDALAVGLGGATVSYEPSIGWLAQPLPAGARRVNLFGVAFNGRGSAFAVGQGGVILHWNGSTWSTDPASSALTGSQLNAVAFARSGEGWAVGVNGTILHYDGSSWSRETKLASGIDVTSVAVAGNEVFAVAGDNLWTRGSDGTWHEVDIEKEVGSELAPGEHLGPSPVRLVAGLPDGGLLVAGRSLLLAREGPPPNHLQLAAQPLEGIAVALAPFREADGHLRALASVAPPAFGRADVAGYPPGDGELLRETAGGWEDLSRGQFAGREVRPGSDGALKSDPVLALATDTAGEHGWVVGGYAGTVDAARQGTTESLAIRSSGWQTAAIWRYDAGGGAPPPALTSSPPSLPDEPDTVSFAFYSSPVCFESCASTVGAQPDVNLYGAASEIAGFAAQPGGPVFAISGGDAQVGEFQGGPDLAHMQELLSPLAGVPAFSALGPRDAGSGTDAANSWGEAFAESPPPFGQGSPAGAVAPVSSQAPTANGDAHRYYSFNAYQNGGTIRVIVLDNSKGSLQASSEAAGEPGPAQFEWLQGQLNQVVAEEQGIGQRIPVVVITALSLRRAIGASDGEAVASVLARRGVAAVFTTNETQRNEHHFVPEIPRSGEVPIPEYEGGSLSYQQSGNNGVLWYDASVNTQTGQVQVWGVPVINSLALKPLNGLNAQRSQTLQFEAIARRPAGSLATIEEQSPPAPGYENYVAIPSSSCGECVSASYAFTSSDPTIGNFVEASGPGSPYPKLDGHGHPIPSAASGLFCAYNAGTTTVSITAGLLSYSLPVTVQPGGFGAPCGTVVPSYGLPVERVLTPRVRSPIRGAAAPPPPPPSPLSGALPAHLALPPPPAPAPALAPPPPAVKPPAPKPPAARPPARIEPAPTPVSEPVAVAPAILPTPTPPVEPIPPGASGYAQSPSAAERREKAEKEASQSAFTTRPPVPRPTTIGGRAASAASGGTESPWYYWALGATTLLALILSARGLRPRSRARPALLDLPPRAPERRHGGR